MLLPVQTIYCLPHNSTRVLSLRPLYLSDTERVNKGLVFSGYFRGPGTMHMHIPLLNWKCISQEQIVPMETTDSRVLGLFIENASSEIHAWIEDFQCNVIFFLFFRLFPWLDITKKSEKTLYFLLVVGLHCEKS